MGDGSLALSHLDAVLRFLYRLLVTTMKPLFMPSALAALAALVFSTSAHAQNGARPADMKFLLDGVREIAAPGSLLVFGPTAFPVVLGGVKTPTVA